MSRQYPLKNGSDNVAFAYPNADILEMSETGIHKVKYEETEHYKITKLFIDNPEQMLRHLL